MGSTCQVNLPKMGGGVRLYIWTRLKILTHLTYLHNLRVEASPGRSTRRIVALFIYLFFNKIAMGLIYWAHFK